MKKLNISRLSPGNIFKVSIYMSLVPVAIMFIIGIITIIISASMQAEAPMFFGISYVVMSVFMIIFYGAIGALMALVYNVFSKKFGGLEIYVDEHDDVSFE